MSYFLLDRSDLPGYFNGSLLFMMHALEDGAFEGNPTYAEILAADLEGRPKKLLRFKDEW